MMTVQQAYDLFLSDRETYCKDSTISYYEKNISYFFRYLEDVYEKPVSDLLLSELERKIIQKYILYLRNQTRFLSHPFKVADEKKGHLMNSTIRIYVRAVRVFFNFCFQEGFIKMNLSAGVKLPANDAKLEMPLFAHEVEQVDSMFLSDSIFGARNLAIVHCMLDCGLRSQEVIKLCIHHVHFDKNVIEIVQSKYDKSRVVFLPPDLASNLQKYLSFRPTVSSDRLFLKNDETPIDYNVIKQLFSRIRSHTGIYRLHPHLLRHTFGVSYLIGGGNLEFLRDMMGHSDYNVTRTYVSMANQYRMMGLDVYRLPDKLFQITV